MTGTENGSSPEEIRRDIEQTREELARTADQLTAKLDVKSHAADAVTSAAHKTRDALPDPVRRGLDHATNAAAPISAKASPHTGKIIAGVGAAVAALVLFRRRRG